MVVFTRPPKPAAGKPRRPLSPFEEPVEVGKTAVEQVMGAGAEEPDEPLVSQPQQESLPEEIVEAQHRARLKQVRAEVEQIRQQEREKGRGKRETEEAEKQGAEEQKRQAQKGLVEPQGKRPRGIWAGVAGLVKKLQRRVESPRGPVQ